MYSDLTGTMKGVKSTSKREIFPIFLLLFPNPRTTFFFQYIQFFHFQKYCFVRCQNMENSVDSDVSGIKSFGYFCDKDFQKTPRIVISSSMLFCSGDDDETWTQKSRLICASSLRKSCGPRLSTMVQYH